MIQPSTYVQSHLAFLMAAEMFGWWIARWRALDIIRQKDKVRFGDALGEATCGLKGLPSPRHVLGVDADVAVAPERGELRG